MAGGPMGQVRKDILNGWKEIGGYVCRDVRTVERWEKQRGLPVRRVPGAGRATVYALIPELDEWLARTQAADNDEADQDTDSAGFSTRLDIGSLAPAAAQAPATESRVETGPPPVPDTPSVVSSPTLLESMGSLPRGWLYSAAAVCGIALLVLAARPFFMHSGAVPLSAIARRHAAGPDAGSFRSAVPYRSLVPGVDDLYLRGIYFYEQRTSDSLEHSRRDFLAAIAKDANFAPAYAGLANTYNLMREYSGMSDAEAYGKAREAAEHAIQLDPNLPQAHVALGFVEFFWSRDAAGAESEFRRAILLDPNSSTAHHWYGSMLLHEGRFPEANDQLDLAQRLEPTSASILSTRALALGLSGHRNEASDMLQELLTEVPTATSPHASLATLSLIVPRDPPRYLEEFRRVGELRHDEELLQMISAGAGAYHQAGENAMWLAMLNQQESQHPANRTYYMMEAEAALGRKDAAFADLRQLIQNRDSRVIGIVIDPTLAPLRSDPRFAEVLKSIGLPPLSTH
jgi:hypothetical protein